MAKVIYTGVSSKARKIKSCYIGVGNKARKIKKAYVGINNKARLCYSSGPTFTIGQTIVLDNYTWLPVHIFSANNNYVALLLNEVYSSGKISTSGGYSGGWQSAIIHTTNITNFSNTLSDDFKSKLVPLSLNSLNENSSTPYTVIPSYFQVATTDSYIGTGVTYTKAFYLNGSQNTEHFSYFPDSYTTDTKRIAKYSDNTSATYWVWGFNGKTSRYISINTDGSVNSSAYVYNVNGVRPLVVYDLSK